MAWNERFKYHHWRKYLEGRHILNPYSNEWLPKDLCCYSAYNRNAAQLHVKDCAVQCDECKMIVHEYYYIKGQRPARYPVPAIREGYEYARCLNDGRVTLIHWYQGRI